MLLSELFDCSFVDQFIVPVAIRLGHDKVAQIRDSASRLVSTCTSPLILVPLSLL